MFEKKSSTVNRLVRVRPLLSLLVPLCLAPLASCANDTYLAQNYSTANPGYGQQSYAVPPPTYAGPNNGQFLAPPQLDELVSRIALYPDDLVGIILPASTYPLQIVQAARYLDAVRANSTLSPDDSWDNAVVALLNYPDVINMMNRELDWTERLGQAVIIQQGDVIAAIGQFRAQVQAVGNLRSDDRQIVEYEQGAIRIRPANPQIIYVPQYEPARVIVYSSEPAFGYFPRPYPVYYYNYASGYPSGFSNFWGVSTMFTIGWGSNRVRMHDYDYYDDPRFDHPHNGYFFRRSHHGWDDHDGPSWGDDDRDGRDDRDGHHGGGERPREHDWQPRGGKGPHPIAVGGAGGGQPSRGNGRDGDRFTPSPAPELASPTRTIREGSPRAMQPPGGESSVRRGATVVPGKAPNEAQSFERARNFSPPPRLETPSSSTPMNIRRRDSTQGERREFVPMPAAPSSRMSMPPPQRMEREAISMPRNLPSQPAPVRSMRNMDEGRSSARIAPSRPEPRVAPSRPEPRIAPSRPEPRAPAASSRSSDAPTATRRGGDDDDGRGRGSRDR